MEQIEQKINIDDIANPQEINLLQHLECTIDYKISLTPVICTKCETIFCKNCMEDWKKKSNTCPMRCTPLQLYSPGEGLVKQQLMKIKLFCVNKIYGCNEEILIAEMKLHEKNCLYTPIKCDFCLKDLIPKVFYAKHLLEECKHNLLRCISCDSLFYPSKFTEHLQKCVIETIFFM